MAFNTNQTVATPVNSRADGSPVASRPAVPVAVGYAGPDVRVPTDRVRWAAILAGIFTVLAALIFFVVLGIALGLTAFDADNIRGFGIGAGLYGVVSALISFALGGFMAAKTAARRGTGNAILQSGMVWIVTIALIVNFIGTGVGSLLNLAGSAASTAAVAGANVVGEAAGAVAVDPAIQATASTAIDAAVPTVQAQVGGVVDQIQEQVAAVTPEDVEQAAQDASSAAWWALLGLGVSAAAALGGGLLGTRSRDAVITDDDRDMLPAR
jgi:hypothetical protein